MTTIRKTLSELRSQRWFAANDMRAFSHRQREQQMGLRRTDFMGKPVIAIINTWSELSPCHAHLRDRADAVKRGVLQAGGHPVELPALSVGEVMVKPTTMLYRNFLAMETEELLRSHPVDGAVLLGGCDKSTPGLLMGAISMDLPAIYCPAGPMLNGSWRGQKLGAGTHTLKYWDELRAGNIDGAEWIDLESRMTRSNGTCNTMGTASTMTSIAAALRLDGLHVNGRTLGENIANATCYDDEVIRPLGRPVVRGEAVAVLRGNLAPDGAVLKVSAASEALLRHRGRAVVFESRADLAHRIDDPALAVDASSVLVLKLAGPVASGMPEWGALPIPKKLLAQGVRDMVRVSDARMSGTHYGTCVLHVAPESAVGGPLALVRDGDEIELDVPARRLHLHVADSELAARRTAWGAPELPARGYARLYRQHVAQAPQGCDFDFLENGPP